MAKCMHPNMSVCDMVDSFIFIMKGSRVINRHATDWGDISYFPPQFYKDRVYTLAEMKRLFAHRVHKSKWKATDPFQDWLNHPRRLTAVTLHEAMALADRIARGLISPIIDVDAIMRNSPRSLAFVEMEARQGRLPSWATKVEQAKHEQPTDHPNIQAA